MNRSPSSDPASVDFAALYDGHAEYIARRQEGSFEQAQIDIEVRLLKLPYLAGLLQEPDAPGSVLEIGCATGELIAAFPVRARGRKAGIDISAANIAVARERHPEVEFRQGDFRALPKELYDAVIMSDVLEHVPDDEAFLRDAAAWGRIVLVNLPLEDNWLNRNRRYGPDDASGHLRKYSLADALALFRKAGLEVIAQRRIWVHETPTEAARRDLRRRRLGFAFSGNWLERSLRRLAFSTASALRPVGRRLFASNLFVAARAASSNPGEREPPS